MIKNRKYTVQLHLQNYFSSTTAEQTQLRVNQQSSPGVVLEAKMPIDDLSCYIHIQPATTASLIINNWLTWSLSGDIHLFAVTLCLLSHIRKV